MRAVTRDDFYRRINPLDVIPTIQPGPYPYTSIWKIRHSGKVVGKTVGRRDGGRTETDYFLDDAV